ncbi:histidinol dehydrogenase [Spirochaeta africana]|uniref:Histidinol dehydrogenase n=1 Tax=Spirochaeta africana (strain ATCC 700263 / DSM 8902 / Z-7692) TaxID=889378 RepID=H9UIZ2_SPIAZ|nr:histidinol dehydrogenase [Spirochaeta africana]AFG37485.1 histidinol dehydrogenase [Spirochaeta africana DSM 8902]
MQMQVRRWKDVSRDEQQRFLKRSELDISNIQDSIQDILDKVRADGDTALRALTNKLDKVDLSSIPLRITDEEFAAAADALDPAVKEALDHAFDNVTRFHKGQVPAADTMMEIEPGIIVGERHTPIDSVGLYVPHGRGSFPSMVYMQSIPAKLAGVPRIVMVTPPGPDGRVDPAVLYAAAATGVDEVYRVGGPHAIAALAYGTETIARVDKIQGPGSMYVTAAKRLLVGTVDIGMPAGPSESIIIADRHADPYTVALDLIIEAEHGSDSSAILISTSEPVAEAVADILPDLIDEVEEPRKGFLQDVFGNYGGIFLAGDLYEAADIVNQFAPEHLQIRTSEPWATMRLIRNASEILLGSHIPFSIANYITGPNAILPTGGNARTYSALSVRDFIKYSSVVYLEPSGYDRVAGKVTTLADYEGFQTHAKAIRERNRSL